MRLKYFSLVAIIFIINSCTGTNNTQECATDECLKKQAYDQVIAVHDEVMPKLSYISALKGHIETQMDLADDSLVTATWHILMINLDVADEAMWVWMRQFNADLESVDLDEALAYLKSEQENIDEVASKINNAIANAEAKLESQ